MKNKLVCLTILDGFGIPTDPKRSGIIKENTSFFQYLKQHYPTSSLEASGEAVGLSKGLMGTSEIGHMTMGIGRVAYQPIERINRAIKSGEFFKNETLLKAFEYAKNNNQSVHLLGMPTDGAVHSLDKHLYALLKMAKENGVDKNVFIHYFTDGRDTPPKSAEKYLSNLNKEIKKYGVGEISTVCGRFYALDRDKNFDRVEKAYNAMVYGKGEQAKTAKEAIEKAYARGERDEFILPTVITETKNGNIKPNDVVMIYNFRTDRERQLAEIFNPESDVYFVNHDLKVKLITMTNYDEHFTHTEVVFNKLENKNILSEVLSGRGYTQLKIAETEKYAHVTFFFNDGKQDVFKGEDRILINSEKLKDYSVKPEMSAKEVADATIKGIKSGKYNFIVTNFANPDMVGHSGNLEGARKAIAVVNHEIERVVKALLEEDGEMLLTADHGNADIMMYEDGTPCTSHTTALVPVFLIGNHEENRKLNTGSLADVAPTILELFGETQPKEMTGKSLIKKEQE